ncbi:hypothetical protein EOD41_01220 [Mucilaginibacter limnophilus]|uniref:Uncharacterized protein n=1 Tax=Mucilaginibacter limnophilus TaxID=1932778 RepID=A0A437MY37_9SPHI|nr:hypothetical protein [Mucilaginibacter limnophilus]RVU02590.1 hypothetical protein EOD41_01220 [Mucilaginibacter limnophilus]
MKQVKPKSSIKLLRESIKNDVVAKLKEATAALGQNSKKLDKKIEKESGQLAKKIAKAIKPAKSNENTSVETKAEKTPVKTKKITKAEKSAAKNGTAIADKAEPVNMAPASAKAKKK